MARRLPLALLQESDSTVWVSLPSIAPMANARRCTLDDPKFVVPQVWLADGDDTVWWDLTYLQNAFKLKGMTNLKPTKWLQNTFTPHVQSVSGFAPSSPPEGLGQLVGNTFDFLAFLLASADRFADAAHEKTVVTHIRDMLQQSLTLFADEHASIVLRGAQCWVSRDGQVVNFASALQRGHGSVSFSMANSWDRLNNAGDLEGPYCRDTHHIADVLLFPMFVMKRRRQARATTSDRFRLVANELRIPLVRWAARLVDSYIRRVYTNDNPVVNRAPPSIIRRRAGNARGYTLVSPEASWDLMVRARGARANCAQAIRLRSDDASLGCGDCQGDMWVHKRNQMYMDRSTVFARTMHWNLVADPGMHSYRDVMVSALWSCSSSSSSSSSCSSSSSSSCSSSRSWELQMACLPQFQILLPGKKVTSNDCNMHEEIVPYAQTEKLERVSTYRQLQGHHCRHVCYFLRRVVVTLPVVLRGPLVLLPGGLQKKTSDTENQ